MAWPLIIGPAEREAMQKVKEYAIAHPLDITEVQQLEAGNGTYVSDRPGHNCVVPVNFWICFSVEAALAGSDGMVCHLSISIANHDKFPSPEACQEIVNCFGGPENIRESCAIEADKLTKIVDIAWLYKEEKTG